MSDLRETRLSLIPVLAENSSSGYIGRTALMKYLYFLQTLRSVPLGYRFTLYSYGPFDSDVLADMGSAETLGAISSEVVLYPGGYGYQIRPGQKAGWLKNRAVDFLTKYDADIKWVVQKFGVLKSSSELELVSTIVYVDREAAKENLRLNIETLGKRVQEIKPHFTEDRICEFANWLASEQLLAS